MQARGPLPEAPVLKDCFHSIFRRSERHIFLDERIDGGLRRIEQELLAVVTDDQRHLASLEISKQVCGADLYRFRRTPVCRRPWQRPRARLGGSAGRLRLVHAPPFETRPSGRRVLPMDRRCCRQRDHPRNPVHGY